MPVTADGAKELQLPWISLRRSYRDRKSGEWKQVQTLGVDDLLPPAMTLVRCFELIQDRKEASDEPERE